jgi:hypothetical protein
MIKRSVFVLMMLAFVVAAGCRYSAYSGLPQHIQTVRIPVFKCNQFYYGLESKLTREIIERMVADPRVKVVREGEDALLTGEITNIERKVSRSNKDDRPTEIRLTITVKVNFEDKVNGDMLLDNYVIKSDTSSSAAGAYDIGRGESRSGAESEAIKEIAREVVRRTVGMW